MLNGFELSVPCNSAVHYNQILLYIHIFVYHAQCWGPLEGFIYLTFTGLRPSRGSDGHCFKTTGRIYHMQL